MKVTTGALEILENIFFMFFLSQITSSQVTFAALSKFNAISRLNAFKKRGQGFLPRIYINRVNILPKAKEQTGEITGNVK